MTCRFCVDRISLLLVVVLAGCASTAPERDRQLWEVPVSELFNDPALKELVVAASTNDARSIEMLHRDSVRIDEPGLGGTTALFVAVDTSNIDSAQKLLALGANPDVMLSDGRSPIHAAVTHRDLPMLRVLMEYQVDANMLSGEISMRPPIFYALSRLDEPVGESPIMSLLLQYGADPNIPSASGLYAIHSAASTVRFDNAYQLLLAGANPDHPNLAGTDFFDVVVSRLENLPCDSNQFPWLLKIVNELKDEKPWLATVRHSSLRRCTRD